MANGQFKNYVIYPLYITPRSIQINPVKFLECIRIEKVKENILKTYWRREEIPYSIIGDYQRENLVFGRLLRLNKDDIDRIDIDKLKEEIITNGPSDYVAENSHFVLDTQTNLVFAEYNPNAVNALSSRASDVFYSALRKCFPNIPKIEIKPAPTDEFLKDIIDQAYIKKYHLDFPSVDLPHLESIGADSRLINEIAESGRFGFDIGMKLKDLEPFTTSILSKHKNIAKMVKLIGGKSYKVSTSEGSFDLIKENLMFHEVEIERGKREEMEKQLYAEIENLLRSKSDRMLKFLEKRPDLERKWDKPTG